MRVRIPYRIEFYTGHQSGRLYAYDIRPKASPEEINIVVPNVAGVPVGISGPSGFVQVGKKEEIHVDMYVFPNPSLAETGLRKIIAGIAENWETARGIAALLLYADLRRIALEDSPLIRKMEKEELADPYKRIREERGREALMSIVHELVDKIWSRLRLGKPGVVEVRMVELRQIFSPWAKPPVDPTFLIVTPLHLGAEPTISRHHWFISSALPARYWEPIAVVDPAARPAVFHVHDMIPLSEYEEYLKDSVAVDTLYYGLYLLASGMDDRQMVERLRERLESIGCRIDEIAEDKGVRSIYFVCDNGIEAYIITQPPVLALAMFPEKPTTDTLRDLAKLLETLWETAREALNKAKEKITVPSW